MSQIITRELRHWIVTQAEAGCTPESVLQAMKASGWQEDIAIHALETTLSDHLRGRGLSPEAIVATAQSTEGGGGGTVTTQAAVGAGRTAAAPSGSAARRGRLPEPDVAGAPLTLDAGDRRVAVLAVMEKPRVVVLGGLLSDEECDALVALAAPRLARSRTVQLATGGEELNDDRTSDGMFFHRGEHPVVARIEARIARLVHWPVENGEGIQVLRYRPGAEYKPHYDYFDPAAPGTPSIVRRGGQRLGTVVMYLAEPEAGGGTVFPDVNFEVLPRKGNAVFFSYDRPDPSTGTLHGGSPVLAGEKWIATKWLREREFV